MRKTWLEKLREIDIEKLREIVKKENAYKHVLSKFGIVNTRGHTLYNALRKVMKENNIDYSHFGYSKLYNLYEVLIENSTYNIQTLKKRLMKENILKNECEICKNKGEWHGQPLVLQLHHINGKNNDNRLENLSLLCPNCHSQTDTFGGKNLKKI